MAKQLKLTAQTRLSVGRTAVKKIKKQGLVPAVVYGGREKPLSLTLNAREITTLLSRASSEHFLVDLEINDGGTLSNRLALIQEVQHDAIKRDILHVDFHAVQADETFDMLMGVAVPPRKKFIQTHAREVQNLDV